MSADRLAVSPGPFFTAEEYNSNLSSGDQTTFTYEGTREEMVRQRLVERGNGAAILRLVNKGDGNYQLIATYNYDLSNGPNSGPGGSEPQSVHDLEVSVEIVDAFQSVTLYSQLLSVLGGVKSSTDTAISVVQKAVGIYENGIHDSNAKIDVESYSPQALSDAQAMIAKCWPSNADAQKLMNSLFQQYALRKATTKPEFNSVYRRSITAATPLQVQASRTGEGMIWTSAEISAFENLPAFWWFNLPSGLQWLKYPCNVNLVAGGKTRVDYWYQSARIWSGLHFVPYGSAVLDY